MRKPAIHALFFTAATLLLLTPFGCRRGGDEQVSEPTARTQPIPVSVEIVARKTREEFRKLNGDVMPWSVVPLLFKVGGRITQLEIEEGQPVSTNQFIGALDTRDYRLIRDLASAQIDALNPHLDRALRLKDAEVVPQATVDELSGRMKVARVQKTQADAQLSYTRLHSPVSGIILQKKATVGDMTDPQHPVAIVAQMERVKVILSVTQRDVPYLQVGDRITLTTTEISEPFAGTVHAVGFAAEERTRTFPITLEVPNPNLQLRAGMIVEAAVKIGEREGIFIPLDAISRSASGMPTVMVVNTDAQQQAVAQSKLVSLGSVLGEKIEILTGLNEGDRVIIRGQTVENDPVQIQ
ncbi:MAG: efflux RND transporter periplasmic adaptor subunit [Proteobacteria bacterium]|nr:efflux RND transporter periplasmic adaptor subunit [Pseudomonadota bacterium]